MIEYVQVKHDPIPVAKKFNPLWWFGNDPVPVAPEINNGLPYLPNIKTPWVRNVLWHLRNPMANFVGYVAGVEDRDYVLAGPEPALATTWRDVPERAPGHPSGWKNARLRTTGSIAAAFVAVTFAVLGAIVWPGFYVVAAFSLVKAIGILPFFSYYRGNFEFYFGWRPESGGFGIKIAFRKSRESDGGGGYMPPGRDIA